MGTRLPGDRDGAGSGAAAQARPRPSWGARASWRPTLQLRHVTPLPPQGCGPRGRESLAEGRPASSTSWPLFCDVCFCVQVRLSPETRKLRWQAEEVAPRDPGPWSRGTPQTARYLRSTPSSAARLTECAVAGRSCAPEHTPRGGGAWMATGLSPTCPPPYGRHYVPRLQIPVLKSYPHCLRMWLYLVTADEVIRVALIQRDRHTYKTGAFGQTRGWRHATRTRRRLARATERGLRGSQARRPLGRGQLACRPARPWTSAAEVPSRGAC